MSFCTCAASFVNVVEWAVIIDDSRRAASEEATGTRKGSTAGNAPSIHVKALALPSFPLARALSKLSFCRLVRQRCLFLERFRKSASRRFSRLRVSLSETGMYCHEYLISCSIEPVSNAPF